jgi:L-lactate dehydrogenase (cytochrome)
MSLPTDSAPRCRCGPWLIRLALTTTYRKAREPQRPGWGTICSRLPETMADRVNSPRVLNITDLRHLAKRRLPRVAFDYIDGGADGEVTLRENVRIFDDVLFRPRCAVSAAADLRTKVLGHELALPFALAPVGSSRMFYPRGEIVAAGAAGEAGTAYTLSTLSGCRVDEVGAGTKGPLWYQLYLVGGRDVATGPPASSAQ